eukprot:GILK01007467.1.p1 GENE.GILK01007467.1~~GILK01007467.1.p1  ORF type:complete len:142 (+),score=4.27 GILK01007467.1:62-427(+)
MPPKYGGGAAKCHVCATSAYPLESVNYDQKVFHKTCFKCANCRRSMGLVDVAQIQGDLYCKACFVRLFKTKGNYDIFMANKRSSVDGPPPAAAEGESQSPAISSEDGKVPEMQSEAPALPC